MKVLAVERHDHYCRVVLGRDGHSVTKSVRVGDDLDTFIAHLRMVSREADRDISMKTHGDIAHCEDSSANRKSA